MVKRFIQQYLGISALVSQVNDIDQRVEAIDQQVRDIKLQTDTTLHHFGDYKNRTEGELKLMKKQVDELIHRFESIEVKTETEIIMRTRSLKQLRNHRTRISNSQNALRVVGG